MSDTIPASNAKHPLDFSIQEAMTPEQLQHLLRQFQNLNGAVVTRVSEITPWMVKISGALYIYGEAHFWETEIDIRAIEKADDFLKLVNGLITSFDKAAGQLGRG